MKNPSGFLLAAALFAAAAAVLLPAQRARAQASEFFDDFFSDNLGQPAQGFNGFIQWNVAGGSVDLVGGNVPGAFAYPDGRFVDLGGSTGQPGAFSTKLPIVLVAGVTYNLSFRYVSTEALLKLGGPGANTLLTTADGREDSAMATLGGQTFTFSTGSATFQNFSQDFVATASTVLTYQDLGSIDPATMSRGFDNSGVGIDGVLVAPAAVVPEPAALSLLVMAGALASAGCAWNRRRRRCRRRLQ